MTTKIMVFAEPADLPWLQQLYSQQDVSSQLPPLCATDSRTLSHPHTFCATATSLEMHSDVSSLDSPWGRRSNFHDTSKCILRDQMQKKIGLVAVGALQT